MSGRHVTSLGPVTATRDPALFNDAPLFITLPKQPCFSKRSGQRTFPLTRRTGLPLNTALQPRRQPWRLKQFEVVVFGRYLVRIWALSVAFLCLLCLSSEMPGLYFSVDHNRFHPYPFKLTIHLIIQYRFICMHVTFAVYYNL